MSKPHNEFYGLELDQIGAMKGLAVHVGKRDPGPYKSKSFVWVLLGEPKDGVWLRYSYTEGAFGPDAGLTKKQLNRIKDMLFDRQWPEENREAFENYGSGENGRVVVAEEWEKLVVGDNASPEGPGYSAGEMAGGGRYSQEGSAKARGCVAHPVRKTRRHPLLDWANGGA